MSPAPDPDVLVVGAGPVGVMMGAELRRHGVSCRVIDMNDGPRDNARASVIQPRTLEILEHIGVVDRLLAAGVPCPEVVISRPDLTPIETVSCAELDSPYRFSLSIEQSKTENLLVNHLERLGGRVERRVSLRSFEQDEHGVTAVVGRGGSEEVVRCRYLVGCDGAHSTVRHVLGTVFEGETKTTVFVVAEGRINWRVGLPPNQIRLFVGDSQAFYGPFRDGRGLIAGQHDSSRGVPPPHAEPSLDEIRELLDKRTPGATISDVTWKAYFHCDLRQAERYAAGRVFLAGDAAHVQSPAGGQGMNTGLQDAHNLGWKLGLVLGGRAPASLLDSYHPERHRAGKGMLILNDYLYRVEMEARADLPPPRELRRHLAVFLGTQQVIQQRLQRAVAELDINYRHSPIVGNHRPAHAPGEPFATGSDAPHDFAAAPHAGDRAPDARVERHPSGEAVQLRHLRQGSMHHLLLLAGRRAGEETWERLLAVRDEVARDHPETVAVHLVVLEVPPQLRSAGQLLLDRGGDLHQCYGATGDCCYLVRPDDYIGFRSLPVDAGALGAYLARIFASGR